MTYSMSFLVDFRVIFVTQDMQAKTNLILLVIDYNFGR